MAGQKFEPRQSDAESANHCARIRAYFPQVCEKLSQVVITQRSEPLDGQAYSTMTQGGGEDDSDDTRKAVNTQVSIMESSSYSTCHLTPSLSEAKLSPDFCR